MNLQNKLLGKAFYTVELDKFMNFFKIDKDTKYALATLEFFNSTKFIDTAFTHLSLKQFEMENKPTNTKDFFYAFCNILHHQDNKLFIYFLEKLFLHYHKSFANTTNINIDFKEMSKELAKYKNIEIKESFGEENNESYFIIKIKNKIILNLKGKSIKTLRKKSYKKLFDYLLDFEKTQNDTNTYDELHDLKMM